MDVKVAVGVGSTTLVPRVPTIDLYDPNDGNVSSATVGGRSPGTFPNWGMQLSARVTAGKIFGEMAIGFSRFYFEIGDELANSSRRPRATPLPGGNHRPEQARMNSLEIPLTAGYVPYAEPVLQVVPLRRLGQHVQHSRLRRLERESKGPEVQAQRRPWISALSIYVAGARFGVQVDLGPLNFDFSYTISMNSATATDFRTNSHVFKLFLGWLF